MTTNAGVPLAWLQLTRDKRRFAAALAGIAFAATLMLTQLGFEDALMSTAPLLQSQLSADLVLISPLYQFVVSSRSFAERRLYQTLGVEGVASVESLYMGQVPFKNPYDGTDRTIFAVGFNPRSAALSARGIAGNLDKIRTTGVVLFDSIRRPEFGPVAENVQKHGQVVTEVGGRRVEINGLFQMGTSFAIDGTVVMSDETFLQVLPFRRRGIIDVGLIRLKPGADLEGTKAGIDALLPKDVRVLTHGEFVELERRYWATFTPIGFIFKLGVVMALVVGCIIVYQILYSGVSEHLPEYATLKAVGYSDRYLFRLVVQESMILSVLGFLPGILVSQLVYTISRDATLLPMRMTVGRIIAVYFLTAFMCALSATLATRRLKAADPAEIF
jgi:putative ABC transport system permease protein